MSNFTYTKRKDGRLMKKITINGKPKYLYSDNVQDLEKQYIDILYKRNNNFTIDNNSVTFKQYAEKWFDINCTTKEIATQNSIKNRLNHLYEYFGNVKLKALKPYHIQEFVTGMVKNGFTDVTKRSLAECKRVLNDAIINDVISRNVALGITTPKFPKTERKPLTLIEDKKVLEYALQHKYGLFILVLRYCGLRPEEAVALTVDKIDLEEHKIIVKEAVSLATNQPKTKPTKNLKNRKIPIPDFLFKLLKERVSYCNENNIKYIFTKETDKYSMLTKQALKSHLKVFLNGLNKNSDVEITFTYYQLRHSYCTMLYYAGVKIKKAQELMGHSSADMVYNIYTHLDEERENAEELINDYISSNLLEKSCQKSCQTQNS